MEFSFLDYEQVLEIHQDQIQRYGGSMEIRDAGLLDSALAMPQASFGGTFMHEFPEGMAAAYLFHLVKNHPFVDGNKRTGLASALTFLEVNRLAIHASKQEVEALTLGVASGQIDKDEVIEFFRKHVRAFDES